MKQASATADQSGTHQAEITELEKEQPNTLMNGFWRGSRAILPIIPGIIAFAVAFGVVGVQKGLSVLECMLLSSVVFAGASQFVALDMWGPHLPVVALVLTTFVVNMRHILMGATISPLFKNVSSPLKYISAYFLVDEAWALTLSDYTRGGRDATFLLGAGATLFFFWNISTVAGAGLGQGIGDPAALGLDFAFCAIFLAILTDMYKGSTDLLPWGAAALTAVLGEAWLPGKWYIIMGGLAAGITEVLRHGNR